MVKVIVIFFSPSLLELYPVIPRFYLLCVVVYLFSPPPWFLSFRVLRSYIEVSQGMHENTAFQYLMSVLVIHCSIGACHSQISKEMSSVCKYQKISVLVEQSTF